MGTDGAAIASWAPEEEGTIQVAAITDEDTPADPMHMRVGLRVEEAIAAAMVRPTAVVMVEDTVVVMMGDTVVGTDMMVAIGKS
jgi:hypothetical protein